MDKWAFFVGLVAAKHGPLMNAGQTGERILPHNVAIVTTWQHGPFQQHLHTGRNMCQGFLECKALSSFSFYAAAINPFAVVTVFIPLSETWWAETSRETTKYSQSLNNAFSFQALLLRLLLFSNRFYYRWVMFCFFFKIHFTFLCPWLFFC